MNIHDLLDKMESATQAIASGSGVETTGSPAAMARRAPMICPQR